MTNLNAQMIMDSIEWADLPIDKSHPKYSAWVWGPDDGKGCLNYLTPSVVKAAATEIKLGETLCLNWDMTHPTYPGFGRQQFEHKIIRKGDRIVCDDVVHFNTQHGSQWDGFRHFGYQREKLFYNNTTIERILGQDSGKSGTGMESGVAEWAKEGIAGRGVLLDIYRYCQDHKQSYDPWSTHQIPFDVILATLQYQQVKLRKGDILFFRTGYHDTYERSSESDIKAKSESTAPSYAGIAQDLAIAEWLYNQKISAVAGDAPAFESWPPDNKVMGYAMHEIFLAGWGMPIGEMFYLEELARKCDALERWSFFVTSSPLNVPGGVATTPNVMTIF